MGIAFVGCLEVFLHIISGMYITYHNCMHHADSAYSVTDLKHLQCFQLSDIIILVWACQKELSHQTL